MRDQAWREQVCLGHEAERRLGRSIITMLKQLLDVNPKDVILLVMGRKYEHQTAWPRSPAASVSAV